MFKKYKFLFFILFIEGAALMAVEFMGAKLVAPFYGSSLYVWSTVLISTIAGLTLGYYAGGCLSQMKNAERNLVVTLSIAALFTLALPYSAGALIALSGGMSLLPGICTTCLLLIAPPLFCFGTTGPMVVKLMSGNNPNNGSVAGYVYFTSTLAGIVSTFLFGYYLIPYAGLRYCAVIAGLALACIPILYLIKNAVSKPAGAYEAEGMQPRVTNGGQQIKYTIYLYAVLEGSVVMAIELIAARMLAPYFGASLFVWAAVIGFTLAGLAAGYYLGGRLADKYDPLAALQWTLLGAATLLLLLHFTAQQLTMMLTATDFDTAIIIASCLLVAPPLALLGTVPTLLIKYITTATGQAGSATSKVYALSSASGIVSLVVFGFFIIPDMGLTGPSIVTGILAGAVPLVNLVRSKKYVALAFVPVILLSWGVRKTMQPGSTVEVLNYSEGLLGQLMVADVTDTANGVLYTDRILYMNRIGETFVNKSTGAMDANYLVYAGCLASKLKEHSDALLLGLGGGSIANMLSNDLKLNVDVAELDERVVDASREYFSLSNNVHVVVDDARHYLEQTHKKYDLIFFDVFRGDIPPPHVLSRESFARAKALLNKDGLIVVNFFGFLNGDIGKAGRSIYKTLCAAGLTTRILPTTGSEEERNLLFVASNQQLSFDSLRQPLYLYGKPVAIDTLFIEARTPGLNDATIFTDDKPMLDLMVLQATNNFRQYYNHHSTRQFWENGVPLFQ